jgi:hypothetical protein
MSENPPACGCPSDPAPSPELTVTEARARVMDFAGVEPVIVRTEKWLPGQEKPNVIWTVRIYSPFPADLEMGALTLMGAVEQLRTVATDSPGWRQAHD